MPSNALQHSTYIGTVLEALEADRLSSPAAVAVITLVILLPYECRNRHQSSMLDFSRL